MAPNLLFIFWVRLLSRWFPQYAYRLVKKHMLMPDNASGNVIKGIRRKLYKTKYGCVRTYIAGEGKCIWLVHGPGNSVQLQPLFKKLVKHGYCCIAIEFLPRRNNKDRLQSLQQWANVLDIAVRHIEPPAHVISHGIGASIIGYSKWLSTYKGDLTLVSPVLDLFSGLKQFFRQNRLPKRLLTYLEKELLAIDKRCSKQMVVTKELDNFAGQMTVFYSRSDHTSTINEINALAAHKNRRIIEFKGANTNRIINSRSLISSVEPNANQLAMAV